MYMVVVLFAISIICAIAFSVKHKRQKVIWIAPGIIAALCLVLVFSGGGVVRDNAVPKDKTENAVVYKTKTGEKVHLTADCTYLTRSKEIIKTHISEGDEICGKCKTMAD